MLGRTPRSAVQRRTRASSRARCDARPFADGGGGNESTQLFSANSGELASPRPVTQVDVDSAAELRVADEGEGVVVPGQAARVALAEDDDLTAPARQLAQRRQRPRAVERRHAVEQSGRPELALDRPRRHARLEHEDHDLARAAVDERADVGERVAHPLRSELAERVAQVDLALAAHRPEPRPAHEPLGQGDRVRAERRRRPVAVRPLGLQVRAHEAVLVAHAPVRVDHQQPDPVGQLARDRPPLVREQPAVAVGRRHRVVRAREDDLVQAPVAQLRRPVALAHALVDRALPIGARVPHGRPQDDRRDHGDERGDGDRHRRAAPRGRRRAPLAARRGDARQAVRDAEREQHEADHERHGTRRRRRARPDQQRPARQREQRGPGRPRDPRGAPDQPRRAAAAQLAQPRLGERP